MASEIRVNKITHTAGVGTITTSADGINIVGIATAITFSGSGASLTSIPAGNLTGTLPAIDGSNLTGITGTTINNNANNRIITGSGTANTLEGETKLTFDGNSLDISGSGSHPFSVAGGDFRNLTISGASASSSGFIYLGNGSATTNADFDLGRIRIHNGATEVALITGTTDTSANDDGRLVFYTRNTGGSLQQRLRISSTGNVNIGGGNSTIAKLVVSGAGFFGSANTSKTNDGVIIERNSSDGMAHITAGRSGGNYSGINYYVAGASGVTLRHQIDYASNIRWFAADGTSEKLRISSNGSVGINISNPQSYDPAARALVVGEVDGYGHTGMTIRSNGTDKQGAIYFADGTGSASYRGRVEYRHDTDILGFGAGGSGFMYELTSDRHLQSQNFCINSNVASTTSTKYSQINSDNHGNTFFGINCHLGNNGSSGNHRIIQSNSHGTIGCAGILMGGNGSNNNSHIAFFAFGQGNSAGHDFGQDAWKMRIKRSGDVMEVKTTQNSGNAGMIVFRDGNNDYCGQITSNGGNNTSSYVTNSDYRLKTNVSSITDGIARVKNLKPYQFEWKSDLGIKVDGFFAHEAQTIVPESVIGTKDEVDSDGKPKYQGIDQAKLVPVLTAALQEAIAEIEILKTKVSALEGA